MPLPTIPAFAVDGVTARPAPTGLRATLSGVVDACTRLLGLGGGGLLVIDEQGVPRRLAAGGPHAELLVGARSAALHGPGVEAFVRNRLVAIDDVRDDDRWPDPVVTGLASRVRGVCCAPFRIGGVTVGCLTVVRDRPGPWTRAERHDLGRHALLAETALATRQRDAADRRLVRRLHGIAAGRNRLERGIGCLMARQQLSAPEAFTVLSRAAVDSRCTVADTVSRLLDTGGLDGAHELRAAG